MAATTETNMNLMKSCRQRAALTHLRLAGSVHCWARQRTHACACKAKVSPYDARYNFCGIGRLVEQKNEAVLMHQLSCGALYVLAVQKLLRALHPRAARVGHDAAAAEEDLEQRAAEADGADLRLGL